MARRLRSLSIGLGLLAALGTSAVGGDIDDVRKRAEAGDAEAQYQLASYFHTNRGKEPLLDPWGRPNELSRQQQLFEAAKWYRRAAEQGHREAQSTLAGWYHDGTRGVDRDYQEALRWNRKAAEQGDTTSTFYLGYQYLHGEGTTQDYVQAHKWFSITAALASGGMRDQAVEHREDVARKMTAAQTAEAQKLARKWQEQFKKRQKK